MTLKRAGVLDADLKWIKSSYSTADGPSCVEVARTKSSQSGADGPGCVPDTILVRDSKNPQGPASR